MRAEVAVTFCRDRLRGAVLEGQLQSQKAQAGARTSATEKLIAEQQAVISGLWKLLESTGLPAATVSQLLYSIWCKAALSLEYNA